MADGHETLKRVSSSSGTQACLCRTGNEHGGVETLNPGRWAAGTSADGTGTGLQLRLDHAPQGANMEEANPGGWALQSGQNFSVNHAPANIDFAAIHVWPDNWERCASRVLQNLERHALSCGCSSSCRTSC